MVKRYCASWMSKVPNIVNILNLVHEDFFQICSDMHAYCEKEKPVGMLTLGVDMAQIYVNVSMDLRLWFELLVAQCKPKLRKIILLPFKRSFQRGHKEKRHPLCRWSPLTNTNAIISIVVVQKNGKNG